jgi:hypothetical protein
MAFTPANREEQRDGQWQIAQFHASLPAAEREEGSAW